MLITSDNLEKFLAALRESNCVAIDTETTGLKPYGGDTAFLVSFSTENTDWCYEMGGEDEGFNTWALILAALPKKLIFCKAAFDMAQLRNHFTHHFKDFDVYCVKALYRAFDTDCTDLSLDGLGKKYLGRTKDDRVKSQIMERGLWEWRTVPGKKRRFKKMFFDKVDRDLLYEYAELDSRLTLDLYENLRSRAGTISHHPTLPPVTNILTNERMLTPVIYKMAHHGVQLDRDYVESCIANETSDVNRYKEELESIIGRNFVDSNKANKEAFEDHGIEYGRTEKGNPSFKDSILKKIDHPIVKLILNIRKHEKRLQTFLSFQHYADENYVLHPEIHQYGCVTGRMSVSNPPMQCLEKVENPLPGDSLIRKALIPRQGFYFVAMDYDQFEYRVLLNYAKQKDIIRAVQNGMCVHSATGELMGVGRKQAKTVNFLSVYGGGAGALSDLLNITEIEARELLQTYFSRLPDVSFFLNRVKGRAKQTGTITNMFGRRYKFAPDKCYKAPNYLIQGGTADWIKFAMVKIDVLLDNKFSRMLLQIHDELLFEIHESEFYLIPKIKLIMEAHRESGALPYTVGIATSGTSWQDVKETNYETVQHETSSGQTKDAPCNSE
jgi:DNA polymerase-1